MFTCLKEQVWGTRGSLICTLAAAPQLRNFPAGFLGLQVHSSVYTDRTAPLASEREIVDIVIVGSIKLLVKPVTSIPHPEVSQLYMESLSSRLESQCVTAHLCQFHNK